MDIQLKIKIINEDEMKKIYTIQVELDYSNDEILEIMGKPTKTRNIFIYENENYIIQFEKFNNKWRLILRKKIGNFYIYFPIYTNVRLRCSALTTNSLKETNLLMTVCFFMLLLSTN